MGKSGQGKSDMEARRIRAASVAGEYPAEGPTIARISLRALLQQQDSLRSRAAWPPEENLRQQATERDPSAGEQAKPGRPGEAAKLKNAPTARTAHKRDWQPVWASHPVRPHKQP